MRMVTNTPVGVLAAIVILPRCLDFTVVHQLYARLAPAGTTDAMSLWPQIVPGSQAILTVVAD